MSVQATRPTPKLYPLEHKVAYSKDPLEILFSEWGDTPPSCVVATNVKNMNSARLIICLMDDDDQERYQQFYGLVFQRLSKEHAHYNEKAWDGIFILEDYPDRGRSAIDRSPLKYFPFLNFPSVGWLSPEISHFIRLTIQLIALTMEALASLKVLNSITSFGGKIQFFHASCHLASLPPVHQKTGTFVEEVFKKSRQDALCDILLNAKKEAAPLRRYKQMQNLKPYKLKDHALFLRQLGQKWIDQNKEKLLTTVFPENQQSLIDTILKHKDKKFMVAFMGFQHGDPSRTAYPNEVEKLHQAIRDIPFVMLSASK